MTRTTTLLVLAAILLALLVRVNDLGRVGFETDEGHSAWMAAQPLSDLPRLLRVDSAPPLFYALLHLWQALFPSDAGIRWMSLLAGVAAVPLVFCIGRSLMGERAGLAAAFFLAAAPFHVRFSQIAKNNALLFLVAAAALLAILKACENPRRRLPWIGYALSVAAILYTHAVAPFIILALGLVWLIRAGSEWRDSVRPWVASHVGAALLFLPWAPIALHQARVVSKVFWARGPDIVAPIYTLSKYILIRPQAPALPYSEIPGIGTGVQRFAFVGDFLALFPEKLWWILPLLAVGLSAALLIAAGRWRLLLILAALFAVPVGTIWVVSQWRASIYLDRVMIPALLPAMLILAAPFAHLGGGEVKGATGGPGRRRLVLAAVTLSTIVFPMMLFASWYHTEVRKNYEWREAGAWLAEEARAGEAVVYDAHFGQILLERYLGDAREVLTPYGLPSGWYEGTPTVGRYVRADGDLEPMRRAAAGHGAFWLVRSHTEIHDPRQLAIEWCELHLYQTEARRYLGIDIRRYESAPPQGEETRAQGG